MSQALNSGSAMTQSNPQRPVWELQDRRKNRTESQGLKNIIFGIPDFFYVEKKLICRPINQKSGQGKLALSFITFGWLQSFE